MQLNLHGDKDAGILIRELTNKINKLDITVQAFYELMKEKGITQEQLNAKIDEIISREVKGEYGNRKKLCPKCGKVVQESNSTPHERQLCFLRNGCHVLSL